MHIDPQNQEDVQELLADDPEMHERRKEIKERLDAMIAAERIMTEVKRFNV